MSVGLKCVGSGKISKIMLIFQIGEKIDDKHPEVEN
jgi:hypothetical protein